MKKVVFTLLLLLTSPAFAQQPPANPDLQACHSLLFERVQAELNVRTQAFKFSDELVKVQVQLKAMKDKYEPEKKDAK